MFHGVGLCIFFVVVSQAYTEKKCTAHTFFINSIKMDIKRTFTVYGNYIESQVINVSGNLRFGDEKCEKKSIIKSNFSDEEIKSRIEDVMINITQKRKWFCIIKVLMWIKKIPNGDFRAGVEYINTMFDAGLKTTDAYDFSSTLNTLSLSKPFEQWEIEDSPIQGKTFCEYYNLTKQFWESF